MIVAKMSDMLKLIIDKDRETMLYIDTDSFNVYQHPNKGGIATHGNFSSTNSNISIKYERSTNDANNLDDILLFVNAYNLKSYASKKGATTQYLLDDMVKEGSIEGIGTGNFVDFSINPDTSDVLNIYTTTEVHFQEITKKEKEKEKEGEAGYNTDGKYQNEYEAGEHIPKDRKEIDRAILEIVQLFTPAVLENLTNFSVTSSASDEYGFEGGDTSKPIHHGASNGSGDPGEGNDHKTKNEYLAYQRGKYFLDEIIKGIEAKGHPGLPSPTVNWKVQVGGPEQRFIDINLNAYKEAIKGKTWIETDYDFEEGKEDASTWKKGTVYHYEVDLEMKSKKFMGITTKTYE